MDLRRIKFPTDKSLYAKDRILRVGNGLPFGNLPHQSLPLVRDSDYRRRGAPTLGVGNDFCLPSFHYGNARIGSAQIYTDYFAHLNILLYSGNHFFVMLI